MSVQADYTEEEWRQLTMGPVAAGLYVTSASLSGPFGVVKEMVAMVETILQSARDAGADSVVNALFSQPLTQEGVQEELRPHEKKDTEKVRAQLLEDCKSSAALLTLKGSAEEAGAYKRLVLRVAQKVAEAASEGGFLGFGGTQVNNQEMRAYKEISSALGLAA